MDPNCVGSAVLKRRSTRVDDLDAVMEHLFSYATYFKALLTYSFVNFPVLTFSRFLKTCKYTGSSRVISLSRVC